MEHSGFIERLRAARPDGAVMHAQLSIAEGAMMMGTAGGEYHPPHPNEVNQYVHVTLSGEGNRKNGEDAGRAGTQAREQIGAHRDGLWTSRRPGKRRATLPQRTLQRFADDVQRSRFAKRCHIRLARKKVNGYGYSVNLSA